MIRVRVVVAFAGLLAACIAAPVLAASESTESGDLQTSVIDKTRVAIADAEVAAASAQPEAEGEPAPPIEGAPGGQGSESELPPDEPAEAGEPEPGIEREEALETPQAIAEREQSQFAYTDLAPEQTEELLRESFAPQLRQLDADPSRALTDAAIVSAVSPTEAIVETDGERALLESTVPIRVPAEDGKLAKVDLGLEQGDSGGFVPRNSIADVSLPADASGAIEVGDIALTLAGGGEVDATQVVASPARIFSEEDLVMPEIAEDTSLLLSPVTAGVELSALVASRRSPEQLSFAVRMPAGAQLLSATDGGAEVVGADAKNELLARISAPFAVDAQGTVVPVALLVKENTVVLDFPHRSMDIAYPLFIDPEIEEHWEGFSDTSKLNYWNWEWSGVPGSETYIGQRSCIVTCWGNGLYVRSRSETTYPLNSYGRWKFVPQGSTTYMRRVIFGPINYDPHGCTANEPHPYVGVYTDFGTWAVRSNAYPSGWFSSIDSAVGGNLPVGSRAAFVGIHADAAANIKCGHDYRLGGAVLYLNDPEDPTVSANGYPSGWIRDNSPFTLNVPVYDPGLGVKSATVSPKDAPPLPTKELACTGHYNSPCPANNTFQWTVSGDSYDQGEKEVQVSAKDAMGKPSNTFPFMLMVDRTPPDVTLSNQLAAATDEAEGDAKDETGVDPLHLPVYNLTIKAEDGVENGSAAQRRSGVASIEVFLDNGKSPLKTWTQAACSNSCGMTQTFTLKANELSALTHHTLKVVVKDQAGNTPREREIGFEYVPATGMKEEYVLQHFPLSAEEDESESSSSPELAVNVMNGNLVYRQRDVDVPGPAADLEVERFYNSLLPESQDTEWGDGWTLAQTPTLETEALEGSPYEATLVEESGAVESQVELPDQVGEENFDEQLAAVIKKAPAGYEVTDETGAGEGTVIFNEAGEATELEAGEYAGIEYGYRDGDLSEIAVDDVASAGLSPEDAAEREKLEDMTPVFKSTFGAQGSGDGQFKVLRDVAVDPTDGTLWVADDESDRVQHFTTSGQFLGKFSTCYDPGAVLVEDQGNVYVACSSADIIRKYSDTGATLQTISKGTGSASGQVRFPLDLALDSGGNLWVADSENDRLQQFDAAGNFKKALPLGSGTRPKGIDIAPDGAIWVTETVNHRVTVLDQGGNVLRRFGSEGAGEGQFAHPSDVVVDSHGYAWVADSANDRVQIFNETGEFVTQFGAKGSGPGQFNDDWWIRLAVDAKGNVYATDQVNARVQRWKEGNYFATFKSTFGAQGSGDGQFKVLRDVAVDPTDGTLWVADDESDRVQHFTTSGQFLGKFSTCYDPGAVLVEDQGNVYVACSSADIIRKYSDTGAALQTISKGTGAANGQVRFPLDLALDSGGNLWVADSENDRLQQFDAAGNFKKALPLGGGTRPKGIDIAPDGAIWVTETVNHRVTVLDQGGNVLRRFGSEGAGEGQFAHPSDVVVDSHGYAWVADSANDRVQIFNETGEFVTQFGAKGSGPGQFNDDWWIRLAVDAKGNVYATDQVNARVQRWRAPGRLFIDYGTHMQDDPSVEVSADEGLVEAVEGQEVGEIDYQHEGELLTAVDAPDGDTAYSYDANHRMTKVTLANGSYAEIAYEATYGRVKSVNVSIEGASPKTTYFTYEDQPQRRTTVTPPTPDPVTTYEFAADGSMLRWWNTSKPPTIDDVGGTLHDIEQRETASPIAPGVYNLWVQASSAEGIASIQILANNDILVSEKTCPQVPGPPVECPKETDEWILETSSFAPGILYLEVIATDSRGQSASERFWVNIPYTPPPDPEAEESPKFADILKFREDFGLDLDLKGDEEAINDRIYNLIGDWNNPNTPSGEVSRASAEKWGVPMRLVDVAEMEYREWYLDANGPLIDSWGFSHYPSSYAGFTLDHRGGGVMRVGFTQEQSSRVAELVSALALAAEDRIATYASVPSMSVAGLEDAEAAVLSAVESDAPLAEVVTEVGSSVSGQPVPVGASDVQIAEARLKLLVGSLTGVAVSFQPPEVLERCFDNPNRNRQSGRMIAGDAIEVDHTPEAALSLGCGTAAFGAYKFNLNVGPNGRVAKEPWFLTAGHMGAIGARAYRIANPTPSRLGEIRTKGQPLGQVQRNVYSAGAKRIDAAAIKLNGGGLMPFRRYGRNGNIPQVRTAGRAQVGDVLCKTGATTPGVKCGPVVGFRKYPKMAIKVRYQADDGDSGSPVWIAGSRLSVGIHSARYSQNPDSLRLVTPLLTTRYGKNNKVIGALDASAMNDLTVAIPLD